MIYPRCAPDAENPYLNELQVFVPSIKEGEGRSFEMQAFYQLVGLLITLVLALVSGLVTGNRSHREMLGLKELLTKA